MHLFLKICVEAHEIGIEFVMGWTIVVYVAAKDKLGAL